MSAKLLRLIFSVSAILLIAGTAVAFASPVVIPPPPPSTPHFAEASPVVIPPPPPSTPHLV